MCIKSCFIDFFLNYKTKNIYSFKAICFFKISTKSKCSNTVARSRGVLKILKN